MYRASLGTRGETRRAAAEAETQLVGRVRPWVRRKGACALAPHVSITQWMRAPTPPPPPPPAVATPVATLQQANVAAGGADSTPVPVQNGVSSPAVVAAAVPNAAKNANVQDNQPDDALMTDVASTQVHTSPPPPQPQPQPPSQPSLNAASVQNSLAQLASPRKIAAASAQGGSEIERGDNDALASTQRGVDVVAKGIEKAELDKDAEARKSAVVQDAGKTSPEKIISEDAQVQVQEEEEEEGTLLPTHAQTRAEGATEEEEEDDDDDDDDDEETVSVAEAGMTAAKSRTRDTAAETEVDMELDLELELDTEMETEMEMETEAPLHVHTLAATDSGVEEARAEDVQMDVAEEEAVNTSVTERELAHSQLDAQIEHPPGRKIDGPSGLADTPKSNLAVGNSSTPAMNVLALVQSEDTTPPRPLPPQRSPSPPPVHSNASVRAPVQNVTPALHHQNQTQTQPLPPLPLPPPPPPPQIPSFMDARAAARAAHMPAFAGDKHAPQNESESASAEVAERTQQHDAPQ